MVSIDMATSPGRPSDARSRGLLRRRIRSCTACPLHEHAREPVPWRTPVTPPLFAVVGEAPGPDEDRRGEPFVGKAGRLLRALILKANLDYYSVAFVNAACCIPRDEPGGPFRAPREHELRACRTNLLDQLSVLGTSYVLFVGATALSVWRPDLKLKEMHGYPGVFLDRYRVMGTYHPAAALRSKKRYTPIIMRDLEVWKKVLEDGETWALPTACCRCGTDATEWDRDGLGYCLVHYRRYKDRWQKARRQWDEGETAEGQTTFGF